MQIHIDTSTDDIPAVIRMLQAYGGSQATAQLVQDVNKLTELTTQLAEVLDVEKVFSRVLEGPRPPCSAHADSLGTPRTEVFIGVLPEQMFKGDQLKELLKSPCAAHALTDDDIKASNGVPPSVPTPSSLFASLPDLPLDAPMSELDSAGQPWNPELHASTKTKVADGTWKKKRGAGKAEPEPQAPVGAPPPPPVTKPLTYLDVLQRALSGGISPKQMAEAVAAEGITGGFPKLAEHPDKVDGVARRLGML